MIVTYNRLELTKQTLNSIFENTDHPFNLIFVDNASKDDTINYLYKFCGDKLTECGFFKGFKIQKNDQNMGIAVGRNQALLLAEDEWLVTLDNDVSVPPGWLTESIDILTKNPKYGMIGVNMENVSYPLVTINGKEFQHKPKGNLGTACIVFPRSFHKLLGFFNTEYTNYAHEDADMGMRARLVGYQLGYIKQAGKHLGEGEVDKGEYRAFKDTHFKANLKKFNENCAAYSNGRKPLYISFKKTA